MDQQTFQTTVLGMFGNLQEDNRAIKADIQSFKEEFRDFRKETISRFDRMDDRVDRLENGMREDRRKLDEVYQSRNTVKIKFGFAWSMFSLFIAIIASGITQLFGD